MDVSSKHTARDLMRLEVFSVSPETPADEATDLLIDEELSGLPVVDDAGHVVGIFSEVDRIQSESSERQTVGDLMTGHAVTIDAGGSLVEVASAFREHAIRRLPVTENGSLVGIIGLRDLVRYIRESGLPLSTSHSPSADANRQFAGGGVTRSGGAPQPSRPAEQPNIVLRDEKRQATRFPREENTEFAVIWHEPGDEHLVAVHDESLTGLGVLVDTDLGFEVGRHIHVVYAGEYLEAEVRHVTRRQDGRYLVGLSCWPEKAE